MRVHVKPICVHAACVDHFITKTMSVYIDICISADVSIHAHTHTYIYVSIQIDISYLSICAWVCLGADASLCMYALYLHIIYIMVHLHFSMHRCVYVCGYVCLVILMDSRIQSNICLFAQRERPHAPVVHGRHIGSTKVTALPESLGKCTSLEALCARAAAAARFALNGARPNCSAVALAQDRVHHEPRGAADGGRLAQAEGTVSARTA